MLFAAFLHRTDRGQAQGGLRTWRYDRFESFLRDGLRLAWGMARKNALAGLWWGGGKGLIARPSADWMEDRRQRHHLYQAYGSFVSSLRGCYVTAEDAGTTPDDLASVFTRTRFATCIPESFGGSGNPSSATARGVVCGMEAALAVEGGATLEGARVVVQGVGNVGASVIDRLLERGVAKVVAGDVSADRVRSLGDRLAGAPVELRTLDRRDVELLAEPCDVLAPCALGGVIGPDTIPRLRTRMICGATNNPLVDELRDGAALAERGIVYVPDFVVNRMGIVACANEHAGRLEPDPELERHLDPAWPNGIPATTQRILREAAEDQVPPIVAADRIAHELAREPHPIFGARTRAIVHALVRDGWEKSGHGAPPSP